jgi:alcohol dehydrogenase (NADP+)
MDIAKKYGATCAQVLLKWAIQTGTSVIPKSVSPQRIAENLGSVNIALDQQDMTAMAKLDQHRRYVDGKFWCMGPYTIENLWDE